MLANLFLGFVKWFRALVAVLFPLRGSVLKYHRHSIRAPYSIQDHQTHEVEQYEIVLPPMGQMAHWDQVLAIYENFSDSDEEDSIEKDTEDSWVPVTDEIEDLSGPRRDFFKIPISITALNGDFMKLKFIDFKTQKTKVFTRADLINLSEFVYSPYNIA
tara:strand:- start:111447 stop:111923 length:477 start_codon:yes stop_codon:yes gene_type:complete